MGLKILVIRLSSIGDIVLTTPVIRAVRQQLEAEVHVLTKPQFAAVLSHNPHIHTHHILPKKWSELTRTLKTERFDAVIDLHNNLRTRRLQASIGGRWYRFDKINLQKWLLTRWKIDRLPRVHIVDRYLAAAAPLGIQSDGRGLDYYIDPDKTVDPARLFGAPVEQGYIAVVIGAAHATKRLTDPQLVTLCQHIARPICLLGGPDDAERGKLIARQAGPHVVNACGLLSLDGSADVVRQAERVYTHDTGMMHIAAALQVPTVTFWGNTVPEFGMYAYDPARKTAHQHREVSRLSCRPCSKIGHANCPCGHFKCMLQQNLTPLLPERQQPMS